MIVTSPEFIRLYGKEFLKLPDSLLDCISTLYALDRLPEHFMEKDVSYDPGRGRDPYGGEIARPQG